MAGRTIRRLIPLLDRVLVERVAPKTKTVGGILLPESAQSKLNEGTVVAVGPGGRDRNGGLIAMSVKSGDRVLLPEFGGNRVKLDDSDKDLALYRDEDILGVLKDNASK